MRRNIEAVCLEGFFFLIFNVSKFATLFEISCLISRFLNIQTYKILLLA